MVAVDIRTRYDALTQAGFNVGEALTMVALSLKECPLGTCGSDTRAYNNPTNFDVGIFQINSVHFPSLNPTATPWGDLTNVYNNAKAAFAIYSGAGGGQSGFKQWCTYPGGCNVNGGANQYTGNTLQAAINGVVQTLGGMNVFPGDGSNPPISGGGGGVDIFPPSGQPTGGGGSGSSSSDTSEFPYSGILVVSAALAAILIGALIWKGTTVAKVVMPGSGIAKAARIAGQ